MTMYTENILAEVISKEPKQTYIRQ